MQYHDPLSRYLGSLTPEVRTAFLAASEPLITALHEAIVAYRQAHRGDDPIGYGSLHALEMLAAMVRENITHT